MRTAVRVFLVAVMMCLLFSVPAAPASARECTIPYVLCGQVKHYAPDTGYDAPILVRCQFGNPASKWWVTEGRSSSSYCPDVDQIGVRKNEEIWCKQPLDGVGSYWRKRFDAPGWHKINDLFDDGYGCTVRRDRL